MSYRKIKASHLRNMNNETLKKRLQDIGITLMRLRTARASGGGVNPGQWRTIKKEKARILTILRERELEEAKK